MGSRHPLAECEKCPLNVPGYAFVPSSIPPNPKIAAVGEAPGTQEADRGKPFVGPSGRLLKTILKHHGYMPSEVMFTNACLCRPPSNATPPKAAVAACRPRLYDELRRSGVNAVLALGFTAASVLVDNPGAISTLRVGPPKDPTTGLNGSNVEKVVPSWHPAYCLRTADAFPTLVTDVGKLKESRCAPWTPPVFNVIDHPDDAASWLRDSTSRVGNCVVDIEVGIEKDVSFEHPNTFQLLCVGLGYAKRRVMVLGETALTSRTVLDELRTFLQRAKIAAHNGKFDLQGLYPHLGGLELWFDTMLAHYALDERVGAPLHGLKVLAVEQLGAPQYDLDIRTYVPRGGNYANIPRPVLYKYNAYDVSCTWDLRELFEERMDRNDLRRVHDLMVRASNQLMYMELNGITIDRTYSNALQGDYIKRLDEIESAIGSIVDASVSSEDPALATDAPELSRGSSYFNPRSPKQIKEFLESQGVLTDSTDVDHLEAIQKRIDSGSRVGQFIGQLLRYRKEHKRFSTYVVGIRKRMYRGRVHTTYLLHGTTSGRLASRNPNLQNIVRDKDIRRQFVVSNPENVLIQADYKQAEGRVIATLAQDEYLREKFSNPDVDLFNELSDDLYGRGNWAKEERVRTKAYFYGLSYGRQAYSIAMEYNIPVHIAEQRLSQFMGLIPATAKWQADTRRRVLAGEDLITAFGRRRRFHLITDENRKDVLNEALSFLPQSTASDIGLSALIRLRPMLRGLGWIRLTIHDALVVECPRRNQDQVTEYLRNTMLEEGAKFTDYVPFAVDISSGSSWGNL
jgi:DNA polymerase I